MCGLILSDDQLELQYVNYYVLFHLLTTFSEELS